MIMIIYLNSYWLVIAVIYPYIFIDVGKSCILMRLL